MVNFNYVLNKAEEQVLELQNEIGEKDAKIEELKEHVKHLEQKLDSHNGPKHHYHSDRRA